MEREFTHTKTVEELPYGDEPQIHENGEYDASEQTLSLSQSEKILCRIIDNKKKNEYPSRVIVPGIIKKHRFKKDEHDLMVSLVETIPEESKKRKEAEEILKKMFGGNIKINFW